MSLIAKVFHICRKGNLWFSFHSLRGQAPRPVAAETSLGDAEYIDADQSGGAFLKSVFLGQRVAPPPPFEKCKKCKIGIRRGITKSVKV